MAFWEADEFTSCRTATATTTMQLYCCTCQECGGSGGAKKQMKSFDLDPRLELAPFQPRSHLLSITHSNWGLQEYLPTTWLQGCALWMDNERDQPRFQWFGLNVPQVSLCYGIHCFWSSHRAIHDVPQGHSKFELVLRSFFTVVAMIACFQWLVFSGLYLLECRKNELESMAACI